ncbi:MAG: serine acetyltransferase [Gammaproteobacteria bacterium]
MIPSSEADWAREIPRCFWDPSRKLLKSIRDYQGCKRRSGIVAVVGFKIAVLRHLFWSIISGADIPINCQLGGGVIIPHPSGIVIHPDASVGVNCLIHQQVTIGVNRGGGVPRISGNVDIGAGAKIIGDITIGTHALVGANAVVVKDVEAYSIVAGVPAKVIGHTKKSKALPK